MSSIKIDMLNVLVDSARNDASNRKSKSNEQILEEMDIKDIEQFLRKKKLERIKNERLLGR